MLTKQEARELQRDLAKYPLRRWDGSVYSQDPAIETRVGLALYLIGGFALCVITLVLLEYWLQFLLA